MTEPSASHEAAIVSKLTLRLMPFLFLLYIVAYIDRINVGFAALQMQQQLNLNDAVFGLGSGIFFIGYFVAQVPSNWMLQRVGAQKWIATLIFVWGVISCCMMFINSKHTFYTMRFLLGIAEAGFFPGMIYYLKLWFPAAARARAVALFMTAAPMAGVIGSPISGTLLGLNNVGGLAGWQWMFVLEGAPAIVLSVVTLVFLTDRPQVAKWLTNSERDWLMATLDREHSEAASTSKAGWRVLAMPSVWLLALIYFGMNTTIYGISFFLPKLIRSQSTASNFQIGFLSAAPYVVAAITMVLVGLHSDRQGERKLHVGTCALIGAIAMTATSFSSTIAITLICIGLALMAANSMYGPFWAMPTTMIPKDMSATVIAIINSIGNLGGFVGPYVIGLLKTSDGGYRGGLLSVSAFLLFASILAFVIPAQRKAANAASRA